MPHQLRGPKTLQACQTQSLQCCQLLHWPPLQTPHQVCWQHHQSRRQLGLGSQSLRWLERKCLPQRLTQLQLVCCCLCCQTAMTCSSLQMLACC